MTFEDSPTISHSIEQAFTLYKHSFRQVLPFASIYFFLLFLVHFVKQQQLLQQAEIIAKFGYFILLPVILGGFLHRVNDCQLSQAPKSFRGSLLAALKKSHLLIIASLMFSFVTLFPSFLYQLIANYFQFTSNIAFLASVLVGLVIAFRWIFYGVAIMIEDTGLIMSFKRSSQLLKGQWATSLLMLLIPGLMNWVLITIAYYLFPVATLALGTLLQHIVTLNPVSFAISLTTILLFLVPALLISLPVSFMVTWYHKLKHDELN